MSRRMVRETQEIVHRHLKRVGLKQTAQRDTILRTFLETRDHLSTDELHRLVQKKDERIGYTPAYRTLKFLAEGAPATEVPFYQGTPPYAHPSTLLTHHPLASTTPPTSIHIF